MQREKTAAADAAALALSRSVRTPPPREIVRIVLGIGSLVPVQRVDRLHFHIVEGEVENVDVFRNMRGIGRTRNDRVAALHVPAQNDLSDGLSAFFRDFRKRRIGKDAVDPLVRADPMIRPEFQGSSHGPRRRTASCRDEFQSDSRPA